MADIKAAEPEVAAQLLPPPEEAIADGEQSADRGTPWRGFLRSGPVRHLPAGHISLSKAVCCFGNAMRNTRGAGR